jgi:sec-independent protein translocase protein TatC
MIRKPDEDLFKDTTMTFGEHLEELRGCLFRALVGLLIGFFVGLYFASDVVQLIQVPLLNALQRYYKQDSLDKFAASMKLRRERGEDIPFEEAAVEQLVGEEGLLFEEVFLAGDDLFKSLSVNYPETFSGVTLPANPPGHGMSRLGPTQIVASDLRDGIGLVQQLVEAGKSQSAGFASQVWSKLSATEQADLQSWAALSKLNDDQKQKLAATLSLVLAEDLNADALPKGELSKQAARLLARSDSLEANEKLRLNRLLLEAAFSKHLAATHPDLVSIFVWHPVADDPRVTPKALRAEETFMIWVKAALLVAVVVSSPWVFWQLWSFVAAGLYPHEKRYVHVFLPFSLGLFLVGASVAFLFVFEPVLTFLFSFNKSLGIDPDPRISEWLGFVLILPLGFGVSFQLPLVMLFLERIGIFDARAYMEKWRVAILAIFVIAMVLTPADPYSMLLMAVPLTFLYFGGVLLCKYLPKGRNPFD